MDAVKTFKERLRTAGQSVTTPRLLMFRALARKSPISTVKLVLMMEENGINRATTYRNIALLRQIGAIRDLIVNSTRMIELSEDFGHHHHHFWCLRCGRLIDFDNPDLDTAIDAMAGKLGIRVQSHQVEMSGLCRDCAKAA